MKKYKKFIKRGIIQPLEKIPFHGKAPLKRILLQDYNTFPDIKNILPGSNYHIAAHLITKLPKKIQPYAFPHAHNCDEINLLLSESKIVYRIKMGDEEYIVSSPATVYIPRGVIHSAEVIKGKGVFIVIIMSKTYKSSLLKK